MAISEQCQVFRMLEREAVMAAEGLSNRRSVLSQSNCKELSRRKCMTTLAAGLACASGWMGGPSETAAIPPSKIVGPAGQDAANQASPHRQAINRSPAAKGLLKRLQELPQRDRRRLLSGQNLGLADGDLAGAQNRWLRPLAKDDGPQVAVVGVDYGWNRLADSFAAANRILSQQVVRGGVATICMHPANPISGGSVHDTDYDDFDLLLKNETREQKAWLAVLDRAAVGLGELRDQKVPVLWRPLHEMNGNWFWWSTEKGQRQIEPQRFIELWRLTHDYLVNHKKLDNLLWVFSPAAENARWIAPLADYYPGDKYVDVVGIDLYSDDPARELANQQMRASLLSFQKPVALCEFGPMKERAGQFDCGKLLSAIQQHFPEMVYFLFWHSWPQNRVAMADCQNSRQMLSDPWIQNLSLKAIP